MTTRARSRTICKATVARAAGVNLNLLWRLRPMATKENPVNRNWSPEIGAAMDELRALLKQGDNALWGAGDAINRMIAELDISQREIEREAAGWGYGTSQTSECSVVASRFQPGCRALQSHSFTFHSNVYRAVRKVEMRCRKHGLTVPLFDYERVLHDVIASKIKARDKIAAMLAAEYQPAALPFMGKGGAQTACDRLNSPSSADRGEAADADDDAGTPPPACLGAWMRKSSYVAVAPPGGKASAWKLYVVVAADEKQARSIAKAQNFKKQKGRFADNWQFIGTTFLREHDAGAFELRRLAKPFPTIPKFPRRKRKGDHPA
jgi:hypothetical protein